MPFQKSWVEEKVKQAAASQRLGHAFLLTGENLEELEKLFYRLSSILLEDDDAQHPDLHLVRPESKTRRIVIEQIRELEHSLQLKAYRSRCKVAGILAAERMCMGSAEPANAFLKTLEEPPSNTIIFLLSNQPEGLLPTIRSRCLLLPIKSETETPIWPELQQLGINWFHSQSAGIDGAYRRAAWLAEYWQLCRASLEKEYASALKEAEEETEKQLLAQIEGQLTLLRDQSLAYLIRQTWEQHRQSKLDFAEAERACEIFEELRSSLSRNMDVSLALEYCCLKLAHAF